MLFSVFFEGSFSKSVFVYELTHTLTADVIGHDDIARPKLVQLCRFGSCLGMSNKDHFGVELGDVFDEVTVDIEISDN